MPRVSAPLVLLPAWLLMVACSPHSLRIAAILDDPMECSRGERLSITLAKNRINRAPERLGKAKVEVDIFELLRDSEYETAETMCQILPKGVVAVLGPSSSPASSSIISNICGEKEVPHFKVAPEEFVRFQLQRFTTLNLHPSNTDISVAVAGILNFFNCTTACLICAKAECLLNLEKLLRQFLISKDTLSVRMLDDTRDPTPLLKEIRDDKTATIIIHANASMSHTILLKAAELGMVSAYYTYIFTNLLSSALLFDAVYAVVTAVQELNRSQEIGVKPLSCGSSQIWQHGTSLMNYLRMVELEGLTGHIEFNSKGQRSNYALKILQFTRNGFRQIGQWHVADGLSMDSRLYASNISDSLFNTTLVVTTILENPYLMLKGNHQEMEGNDRYEGFCVDMLKELAEILRFNYKIRLVGDGVYGVPEANGTWTGMVGELIARKADLAVAGLTITAEREKVIDFSKPFMTLGISILYRVHMGRRPGYFSFLDPFSPGVWLFMLLAYLAVSCVLFLVARLTPYEWYSPHPCAQGRCNLLVNQYSLGNSLWFPVGGFMQQGSTIAPRALSTRCVSGVWWAFTLIIISSYTANLAAFLTVQRMEVPIESVDDLADQTAIEYGTIHGGSSMTFFQNSRYQTYQRMWNYMYSKQPSVFVKSTEEGIARVLNSNYAFLLESTMNELSVQGRVRPGHSPAAGEQPPGNSEAEVVGRGKMSQGGGPQSQRPGNGEYWWNLCGSYLWLNSGHFYGYAGVFMDSQTLRGIRGVCMSGDGGRAAQHHPVPGQYPSPAAALWRPATPTPGPGGAPAQRNSDAQQWQAMWRRGARPAGAETGTGGRPSSSRLHAHPRVPGVPPLPGPAGATVTSAQRGELGVGQDHQQQRARVVAAAKDRGARRGGERANVTSSFSPDSRFNDFTKRSEPNAPAGGRSRPVTEQVYPEKLNPRGRDAVPRGYKDPSPPRGPFPHPQITWILGSGALLRGQFKKLMVSSVELPPRKGPLYPGSSSYRKKN
ncbi:glutamate receptor ionotropic, kainate 4 isoform X2 [Mastomys coucha]|uniref:glutamate receptor ionotropic, kainate 4 isoform X2 n=1 Tax=Mastomys coucha TaxID=35658 RepID=UPI0012614D65|nr:glutamate receptor ionotropic, kainate 4 isoform X2 [Mastomys coucha]